MIEVVRILVAAGDGQNARTKNACRENGDQQGIARIGDDGASLPATPSRRSALPQQHHAGVRGDAPTVERGGDLLAANGWKREREKAIVEHAGVLRCDGVKDRCKQLIIH